MGAWATGVGRQYFKPNLLIVNKQYCRGTASSENPQVIEERPLHPEKFTVLRAL